MSTQKKLYLTGEAEELDAFWTTQQTWLESRGYMLRPRYRPGGGPNKEKVQDGKLRKHTTMDATKISDGFPVIMKILCHSKDSSELELRLNVLFSTEPLASNPKNHCVKVLEVLEVPDYEDLVLLVMPRLRIYNDPPFQTIGEGLHFIHQLFEGIDFLHDNRIAHRNIHHGNVMMDPSELYPDGFHPLNISQNKDSTGPAKHFTRTQKPPRYFLIDFGRSGIYDPSCTTQGTPAPGAQTAPEFRDSNTKLYDPIRTDIYHVGELIRQTFFMNYEGFSFLNPLVTKMIQESPQSRPTIKECILEFDALVASLSEGKIRGRAAPRHESLIPAGFVKSIIHRARVISDILRNTPVIYSPNAAQKSSNLSK
ncbi:hypothetical protein M422DRAFT_228875 [Sphaerobolus stellatus SS14]|uniref:Protein kinase domain-containing protein n=1 Tax=Sphaerobolus stellatus (strain SS14) TaxID=990650 RepID=A0A0C9VXX5_SPHS4|nr:hypothetical protein M422DRAFT_228875 [Sphaerobolus stellatus SS14]